MSAEDKVTDLMDALAASVRAAKEEREAVTVSTTPEPDRLYLDLKGARERLCRAQVSVPAHWRSDLQAALDHIDQAGSALCPEQWSKYDQPEYPEVPA